MAGDKLNSTEYDKISPDSEEDLMPKKAGHHKFHMPKSCTNSAEDLNCDIKNQVYSERLEQLKNEIEKLTIPDLQINSEDLFDQHCDPANPVQIKFNDISAAAYRIRGGVEITPCTRSHMSSITGMEIFFKKDFLQYTGSFKERGARYALLSLSKEQKACGVIAASAGNHAQALCYHGKMLKIPVVVVMPKIAPIMKISNCRSYGAIVIVEGTSMLEAKNFALKLSKMLNIMYINGYDHPNILAGQGTMALEILEQVPDVDAIVIPTGGAGLLAGVAVAAKALKPDIMIIAAESDRCAGFYNSMANGEPTLTFSDPTLADGLAVSLVGVNAFASAKNLVDKCVCVQEEYIAIAILRLLELEKAVVEGAGACGFAAVLQGLLPELKNKKVVIPLCGGNIDTTILGRVLERALAADGRLIKLWVTISDRPGSLAEFTKLVSAFGASIKDIAHERAWLKSDVFSVQVQAVLEVENSEKAKEIEEFLIKKYEKVIMGPYGINKQ
ncbi:threo-3-hydroxyaspartate ammonia-lyase-like [Brachionus plicatilis]|uniref:L-serine deaminase n=1 Tax=Brachionus plicatilis TaxID=10195 RepID=A0A3M7QUR6_BRAPC|nr:threo-3-hydroxyaspartate ammonia-lyase-like [Brachionus plicatilis]